jgi:hypothetical protein
MAHSLSFVETLLAASGYFGKRSIRLAADGCWVEIRRVKYESNLSSLYHKLHKVCKESLSPDVSGLAALFDIQKSAGTITNISILSKSYPVQAH